MPSTSLPESLLALAEIADGLVFITEPSGRMAWCNQTFKDKTGFSEADFLLESDDNPFIHSEDLERVATFLGEFAASPDRASGELFNRFVNRSGEVGHLRSRVAKISWDEGEAFLTICREQQEGENQSTPDTAESYRTLIIKADDVIVKLDAQGRFLFANQRLRDLTQLSLVEQGKTTLIAQLHSDDRNRAVKVLGHVHDTGERGVLDVRLLGAGDECHVIQGAVIRHASNTDESFVLQAIFHDVTESRRLQERLEQKQRLESLGLLAGGIAHDFNNLLTAILANTSLLLRSVEGDKRLLLEDVVTAANRAALLAAEIMSHAGQAPAQRTTVDISSVVRELPSMLQAALVDEVKLVADVPGRPLHVEGSSAQLTQVVMNLVTNAAEASKSDGIVKLTVGTDDGNENHPGTSIGERPEGPVVFVEVRDRGAGMSADTLDRIFDPFFTTKSQGRGLGLSSVLGIVSQHAGAMLIHSEVGKGTTMRIELPMASSAESLPDAGHPTPNSDAIETVLVVDDDALVRDVTLRILEAAGYCAVVVSGGEAAIELLRDDPDRFSVVLLDSMMPGMKGPETRKELSTLAPGLPIVTMSGWRVEADAPGELALDKPFTPQRLVDVVKQAAASRRRS